MAPSVEIMSKELIKPSSPTPHERKVLNLSFIDQLITPIYTPLIFIYENHEMGSDNTARAKRSQHLKQSLSEVLTEFYPFAGRIKGNLSIDCNDSGALFVEAQVGANLSEWIQNASIEELKQYMPLKPFAIPIAANNSYPKADEEAPLLAVQISFFECGGMIIGVCMSHKAGDMASLATFMHAWGAISRAHGEEGEGGIDEVVKPCFDLAGRLFPGIGEDSPFPAYRESFSREELVTKRFLFSKEKLAAIQKVISSAPGSRVKDPTRVEAVSAFIWKQLITVNCAASGSKGDTAKSSSVFGTVHAVNLRSRIKSLPSESFTFGNMLSIASAFVTSDTEDKDKEYTIDDLVWHLRNAIRQAGSEDNVNNVASGVPYLLYLNSTLEQMFKKEEEIGFCSFTSWCRFPIYEVDYGWGNPISVCPSDAPTKNITILMSTKCGEGIEAWVSMLKDEMHLLPAQLLELEPKSLINH